MPISSNDVEVYAHCCACGADLGVIDFTIKNHMGKDYAPEPDQCAYCFASTFWHYIILYPQDLVWSVCKIMDRVKRDKRRLEYDINAHDLMVLLHKQNNCCFYTNEPLPWGKGDNATSLDRLDPKLGYVKGNIAFTTWNANRAKGILTAPEFILMCRAIGKGASIGRRQLLNEPVEFDVLPRAAVERLGEQFGARWETYAEEHYGANTAP